MIKYTINDSYILEYFSKNGIRHKTPINFHPLCDNLQKIYHMSRDEIIKSLKYLEEISIIEGNGTLISLTEQYDKKVYGKRSVIMNGQYTVEERKAARFKMLEEIYNVSGGSEDYLFDIYEIGENLNFPADLITKTSDYLMGENLIKSKTIGGGAIITHLGIVQYERAVTAPDKETEHFIPVNVIKEIKFFGSITDSQIQVGVNNSKQTMINNDGYKELREWLKNLEDALNNENKTDIFKGIQEDIEIIKMNINSEKPNKKYIGIALRAIEGVLIGLTSNSIFQILLDRLKYLIP